MSCAGSNRDWLLRILLAVIGALLLFVLNDFNDRLKKVEDGVMQVQKNVEFMRGSFSGPLRAPSKN